MSLNGTYLLGFVNAALCQPHHSQAFGALSSGLLFTQDILPQNTLESGIGDSGRLGVKGGCSVLGIIEHLAEKR